MGALDAIRVGSTAGIEAGGSNPPPEGCGRPEGWPVTMPRGPETQRMVGVAPFELDGVVERIEAVVELSSRTAPEITAGRARFAGLDEARAEAACKTLKRSGVACFTTRN